MDATREVSMPLTNVSERAARIYTGNDSGTLTVITGPEGVDIGPVTAQLGQHLGDGLAIRTVVSGTHYEHSMPMPPHVPVALRGLDAAGKPMRSGIMPERVMLSTLPSVQADPQTNLGVAYTGPADYRLQHDLTRLDLLGLHPGHRLTVQRHDGAEGFYAQADLLGIPEPVEVGDLAVHARDSVLRAGGRVLIEAGDGQTFLDALHTVGLPSWAPCIGRLELWVVVQVGGLASTGGYDPAMIARLVGGEIARNGGNPAGEPISLHIALTGVEQLIPGLAGIGTPDLSGDNGTPVAAATLDTLGDLLNVIEDTCRAEVLLLGTGLHGDRYTFIDMRHVNDPEDSTT